MHPTIIKSFSSGYPIGFSEILVHSAARKGVQELLELWWDCTDQFERVQLRLAVLEAMLYDLIPVQGSKNV